MTKVILIEDDPTMVTLLETLLDIEGFEVQQATNFDNVVEDIEKANAEIVLMDVYLENHNGIEMLVELRKNNRLNDTKVIMS
ncbi:MAG: response regulator, partial [Chloroflexota bacterium]